MPTKDVRQLCDEITGMIKTELENAEPYEDAGSPLEEYKFGLEMSIDIIEEKFCEVLDDQCSCADALKGEKK